MAVTPNSRGHALACSHPAPHSPTIPCPAPSPKTSACPANGWRGSAQSLKADIEAGRIPGAVIAIARHGKLVALDAYGWRDKAAGVAMTTDTIFNIASMTKPMTAVGAPDAV